MIRVQVKFNQSIKICMPVLMSQKLHTFAVHEMCVGYNKVLFH